MHFKVEAGQVAAGPPVTCFSLSSALGDPPRRRLEVLEYPLARASNRLVVARGRGTPTQIPQRPVPAGTGRCGGLRGPRAKPTDESPHRDRRPTDYPKHTSPITYPWPQTDTRLGQRGQNLLRLKYPSNPWQKGYGPHDGPDFG